MLFVKNMSASKSLSRIPIIFLSLMLMAFSHNTSAQSQLKVLPLGNSVTRGSMCLNGDIYDCTDGIKDSEAIGYRDKLYTLMSNSGYNLDFVGGNKYGYSIMGDPDNAGFSGIQDQQLADVIESGSTGDPWGQVTPGPYLNYHPADIVLLHIGTNDVIADDYNNVNDVSRLLDAIDDYETANGKPVLVFLAKIISPQNYSCNAHYGTSQYNNRLYSMAQSRISRGDKLVWVDMHCGAGLNYYTDMTDQAHPNQIGYEKMADKWFSVIDAYNTTPVVSQIPNQTVSLGSSFTQINLDSYVSDVEDSPQDMIWSFHPSTPNYLTVTIDENRIATITPKDPEWSGYEDIEFVAMDRGKVVIGLQKTDNCITRFSLSWVPEIIGQEELVISEGQSLNIILDDLHLADPDGAPVGLQVVVSEGSNYTISGTEITPLEDFFGQLSIPVKVVDAGTDSNTYPLLVDVVQVNFPPEITSSPVLTGFTNGLYQYTVSANDPDPEDILLYSASEKPAWLQINASTGLLSGTPIVGQQGFYNITVEVTDGNYVDDQSFTLEVIYENQVPEIMTNPTDTALAGETYTYGIQAVDNDNDPLTYFASTLPEWLDFYPAAQVLIGSPAKSDAGENLVILGVTDHIDTTLQAFVIKVGIIASLAEAGNTESVLIYPNPVRDQMLIDLKDLYNYGDRVMFELFDITGKKVMQRELTDRLSKISLSGHGVSNGIYLYFISIKSKQNRSISGKLLVRQ